MRHYGAETIADLPIRVERTERFARTLGYLPAERVNAALLVGEPKKMPPALG